MTITHCMEWTINRDGEDIDVCVDFEMEPVVPAKLFGPPETCYPESGGEFAVLGCWRCADRNLPDPPLIQLSDEETEKFEDFVVVHLGRA